MRTRGLLVGILTAVVGVLTVPSYANSTTDAFYQPPDPLPAGPPGDVLRSRPIVAPAFPGAAGVWQILYRSTDVNGAPIAVSGTVLVPRTSFPGPRPLVVVTPGTRGVPDECAPSKQYQQSSSSPQATDYEVPIVTQLLARGIVVAVTDYQGQGTPGLTSYLVGRPEGYAGLDALRAAQRLAGTGLSKDGPVGIAGYSQGGQAAGWTAQLQPRYAPELNLVGAALGAVPTDMNLQMDHLNGAPGAGFAYAALSGLDFAYPELQLDERYLTARGREIMRQIREEDCYLENRRKFDGHTRSGLTEPDVLSLPQWRRRFATSLVGSMPLPVPAYLYHGTADEIVPFRQFQLLRDAWCGRGQAVELQELPGMEHIPALEAGTVPAVQWLTDRFAGRPPRNSC